MSKKHSKSGERRPPRDGQGAGRPGKPAAAAEPAGDQPLTGDKSRSTASDVASGDGEDSGDDRVIGVAFVWSLVAFSIVGLAVGGVFLAKHLLRKPPEQRPLEVSLPDVRDVHDVPVPPVPFREIAEQAGIRFHHENGAIVEGQATREKLLPETMGTGAAFFDYDQDGDQDLLCVNSTYWPWDPRSGREGTPAPTMALYANDGHGAFEDVTRAAGLDISFYGMGVACGDYDNDGDIDLFLTALGPNHLLRNENGVFQDVTEQAGVAGEAEGGNAWSTSATFFDYDNDGQLDLFVCNYVQWSRQIDLGQAFSLAGEGRAYGPPASFDGTFPTLYHNEGNGVYRDVSEQAGVQVRNRLTGKPVAKSMAVVPIDMDDDGWIDLFVSNDTVQNFVFHNLAGSGFEEIGVGSGVAFDREGLARGAMGVDAARTRNNDAIGLVIGNFSNEPCSYYVSERNRVKFADASVASGIGPETKFQLTFGMFYFDADLDGRLDVLAANGHLEGEIAKVRPKETYEQPPQLFWNNGTGAGTEFVEMSEQATGAEFSQPLVGRGSTFADIDGDGDLDILLMACGGAPRLLRNDQQLGHHWLRVRLRGDGEHVNRDAIGAWVTATRGEARQPRQVMPTRSYMSQAELPVTFGLGKDDGPVDLEIRWPDGKRQTMTGVEIDQTIDVEYP